MLLGVGQEDTGSDGIAPVGRMPVLLCSKCRLGIELAKSFNTVHAGGSTHPSVSQVVEPRQAGRAAWKSRHGQREQVEGEGVAGEVGS